MPLDDESIAATIVAGRFDELIPVLSEGARRDRPVALYWLAWLESVCAVDPCPVDRGASRLEAAARAGHARARVRLYAQDAAAPRLIGEPSTPEEGLAHASRVLATVGAERSQQVRAEASLDRIRAEAPTAASVYLATALVWARTPSREADLRMVIEAGAMPPKAGELLRRELLVKKRLNRPAQVALAVRGDRAVASALCSTFAFDFLDRIEATLVPMCWEGVARGQLGLLPWLVEHHVVAGEVDRARVAVGLCERLHVSCNGAGLEKFVEATVDNAEARRHRMDVQALGDGAVANASDLPLVVRREGLSLWVARDEVRRACIQRRLLPDGAGFESVRGCPLGRPVAAEQSLSRS